MAKLKNVKGAPKSKTIRVAFQGVLGAYSDLAVRQFLGSSSQSVSCEAFSDVFATVEAGKAQFGVLPIENSLAGSIHQNYDLLVQNKLQILAETYLRVEHTLLGSATSSLKTLRHVRSHPQALSQCSEYFQKNPNVKAVSFYDTAGAAQSVATAQDPAIGAIASAYAGELYGLKVLRKNLENFSHNYTRFLLVAKTGTKLPANFYKSGNSPSTKMKTSLAFVPSKNSPGSLFKALGVFALRDIDLTKIESRPHAGGGAFQYQFYLDLIGDPKRDSHVRKALDHICEMTHEHRILGTYRAEEEWRKK